MIHYFAGGTRQREAIHLRIFSCDDRYHFTEQQQYMSIGGCQSLNLHPLLTWFTRRTPPIFRVNSAQQPCLTGHGQANWLIKAIILCTSKSQHAVLHLLINKQADLMAGEKNYGRVW